jgi:hypothetical protein
MFASSDGSIETVIPNQNIYTWLVSNGSITCRADSRIIARALTGASFDRRGRKIRSPGLIRFPLNAHIPDTWALDPPDLGAEEAARRISTCNCHG